MEFTPEALRRAEQLRGEDAVRVSRESLFDFLANLVIDCRPRPQPWGHCIEPWQRQLLSAIVPAVEQMMGQRSDYQGPRWFWLTLPRGHDKTGLVGRLAAGACAFSRHAISGIACATDADQGNLLLKSVRQELRLNPWLAERLTVQASRIRGPSGELAVLSSDVGSASGEKCDLIICDEITWWKRRELFDVLISGAAKRPDAVLFVITNAGIRGSWQHQILERARNDPEHWHVFESPPRQQLASWMRPGDVEAIRRTLPRGHAQRVLDNLWVDATEMPLLTEELILACESNESLWKATFDPSRQLPRPELYVGVDIGRTRDRTVIWTWERVGDVAWTRDLCVLQNTPFAVQRGEIERRLTSDVISLRIDMGGIGYQLAEELTIRYPTIVEGVTLNQARQGQLAQRFRIGFESRGVRILSDPDLRADLQQVEQVTTSREGVPVVVTHRDETGHADRFWAGALGYSALAERLQNPPETHGVAYYTPRSD